jgi:hypothetical protein
VIIIHKKQQHNKQLKQTSSLMTQYDLPGNYIVFHYYHYTFLYLGNSNIYNNNTKKKNNIPPCRNISKYDWKFVERNKIDTPKIKTTYHFTSLTKDEVCFSWFLCCELLSNIINFIIMVGHHVIYNNVSECRDAYQR